MIGRATFLSFGQLVVHNITRPLFRVRLGGWVTRLLSTHGHLNITSDFGPHGHIYLGSEFPMFVWKLLQWPLENEP